MKLLKKRHVALGMAVLFMAAGTVAASLAVTKTGPRRADATKPPAPPLPQARISGWQTTSALERQARSQVAKDRQRVYFVAYATASRIEARKEPSPRAPVIASFGRRTEVGTPQVFLIAGPRRAHPQVIGSKGSWWYKALLPVRPNGTQGFLPAASVRLAVTPYRIVIDRARFKLELWKHKRVVRTFPVGLGTGKTPTPVGRFYIASLVKPPTPNSAYGPFAYGLSAYSDVLTDWRGGGIIGLHGTNDPGSVGRAASHGCIRMRNEDITELTHLLPLGTPILIR